jgi:hypothetical protein
MRTIMAGTRELTVLAAVLGDRLMAPAVVGGALALSGWLCMAAMAVH